MHQGQDRQPTPKPASAKAAVLHRNSTRGVAASNNPATVAAGISFDNPSYVATPQESRFTIKVNLKVEIYNSAQGSYSGLADAIESRFKQAVRQIYTLPKGVSVKNCLYQFIPGAVDVSERYDYKNTAGKYEIIIIDKVLGNNSQNGNGVAGIAALYGSHQYVGKAGVTAMAKTIIHELGHSMGLKHTWEDDFPGNDRNPDNAMSYGTNVNPTFSGEQLFQAFKNRDNFMSGSNYMVLPSDMNTLYGGSTNDRPVRANTGRGATISAPVKNPID